MADEIPQSYRVLARKYRPRNFDEVIGQDALVRTLKNAIETGRIAHAYMLTGVRGVGKTTTARIIARALNYTGPDGKSGPTTGPTDDCAICQAIAEDRQPDVLEMDAASRGGVDDIREILDGVRYAPTVARYKVYIIDEVHMLSKAAFNALLKTLEEPPPRVIFIFATTEIRKVPVTVLSRCQRFDLRRVDTATLASYYGEICKREKVKAEDEALAMIARAADGSVRDGLSLLDQAIALGGDKVTAQQVRDMLGLADRDKVLDLLEAGLKGEIKSALDMMSDLYRSGADPVTLLQDLLDFVHQLTRLKALPNAKENPRANALTSSLTMPTLGRAWQILLKGLAEVNSAPNPQNAAEMVIIRLSYAANLPDPADLIRKINAGELTATSSPSSSSPTRTRQPEPVALKSMSGGGAAISAAPTYEAAPAAHTTRALNNMADIERALLDAREAILAGELHHHVQPIKIEPGRLEVQLTPEARRGLASDLSTALQAITNTRWIVSVSNSGGSPTLAAQKSAADDAILAKTREHPVVAEVLRLFPGTEISVKRDEGNEG